MQPMQTGLGLPSVRVSPSARQLEAHWVESQPLRRPLATSAARARWPCAPLRLSQQPPPVLTRVCRVPMCVCGTAQMHTPDSSRYWLADTYAARHAAGLEPENIDKEFLRLWFRSR
jgi:hypothetical protein